jgi:hypothetical protein
MVDDARWFASGFSAIHLGALGFDQIRRGRSGGTVGHLKATIRQRDAFGQVHIRECPNYPRPSSGLTNDPLQWLLVRIATSGSTDRDSRSSFPRPSAARLRCGPEFQLLRPRHDLFRWLLAARRSSWALTLSMCATSATFPLCAWLHMLR